jgi:putative ABC transport system permease protein
MDHLLQDLRFATRMLGKNPAFTAVAILTLALGIGANAALFSVVDAVMLRPLPFYQPARLVAVHATNIQRNDASGEVSYPVFLDWRSQTQSFDSMSAWNLSHFTYTGAGQAENLVGVVASANLFSTLGVSPVLGRAFSADEDQPNSGGLPVVLSYELWRSHFGADSSAVGRAITLEGHSFNVIGVMPAGFEFPVQGEAVQLWTTIANDMGGKTPMTAQRGAAYLEVLARLKPRISIARAQAELLGIQQRLNNQYPENRPRGIRINPELNEIVGEMRDALLLLFVAVGFVLLIACANVANLLLARATSRSKEIAIRSALGASRGALIRQLLTESVLLSLCGASLGLVLANWAIRALVRLAPEGLPRVGEIGLDLRVLGFTMLVAAATGILFGLAPALQVSRRRLSQRLEEGGRGGSEGVHHGRVRSSLVATEVALAMVLLVGAGLLLRSLSQLRQVNPGFAADHVVTFAISLSNRYSHPQRVEFCQQLLERIRALSGVRAASAIFGLPLQNQVGIGTSFDIEGRPVPKSERPQTGFRPIALDYFHTMAIPLVKGRDFTLHDDAGSTPVVIVNQTLAQRFFPGEDAIGKRIQPGVSIGEGEAPIRQIVGVVGDVKSASLRAPVEPEVYVPHAQGAIGYMHIVVRTDWPSASLIPALRSEVAALDKELPLLNVKSLDDYMDASIAAPRFVTALLGVFAGLAFVLTATGLYAVISYSVAQRTREMGIRIALGAQPGTILRMVLAQGVRLSLIGVVGGVVASLAVARVLRSLLYGVTPTDLVTFATATALLVALSLLASYIPAWRATKIDPMQTLSQE